MKRILFPTDFSEVAERAFVHASYLAGRFNAELHVLHVVVPQTLGGVTPMDYLPIGDVSKAEERPEHYGDRVSKSRSFPVVHAQVEDQSPSTAVLHYAEEHDADLIVMGTHGRSGFDRLLLGSVAEDVVQMASCPVLTVHGGGDGTEASAVNRILVPVDFSEHSKLNISYARELAVMYGSQIDVLHVVEDYALAPIYGLEPVAMNTPEVLDNVRNGLIEMVREVKGAEVPVEVHVETGHPVSEIIAFAERSGAGLIVIATHGLTGLKRFFLGSVTERVVRGATCPVFTVKSFGKELIQGRPSVDTLRADKGADLAT
ncbi:MAG: universal stress protein [Bacteroidota bacterium]